MNSEDLPLNRKPRKETMEETKTKKLDLLFFFLLASLLLFIKRRPPPPPPPKKKKKT